MRTSRKVVIASLVSAVGLALAIPLFTGVLNVGAEEGFSDEVDIFIEFPESNVSADVFTVGGVAPREVLLELEAEVFTFGKTELTGVDFALNGELDTAARTLTGADDVDAGTMSDFMFSRSFGSVWEGSLNLAAGDFEVFLGKGDNRGGLIGTLPSLVSSSIIRALATVNEYYEVRAPGNVNGWDDFDSILAELFVFDAEESGVDINGDTKPDADGLADFEEGTSYGTGPDGKRVIVQWTDLGSPADRGGSSIVTTGIVLDSQAGDIILDIIAPDLGTILLAAVGAYDNYNEGRLVLSVAASPISLLNGPPGVNPVSEFNSGMFAGDPPPQNIFALGNILLRDTSVSPPEWLALDQLPGGLELTVTLTGPAVEGMLEPGGEVFSYRYKTVNTQDPMTGALTDNGAEEDWTELDTEFNFTPFRATVPMGGGTSISMTSDSASAIFATDSAPKSSSLSGVGGGSSGTCFIATAAYGTPLADEIGVLRSLRDSYMLNNMVGTAFVDTYYRLSPPVADVVAHNSIAKALVRTVLVPVVMLSGLALELPGAMALLLLVAFAFAGYRIRRRATRS